MRSWTEAQRVLIHGRFGAFEYLNVDGCIIRSVELASRLNDRETTLDEIDVERRAT